MKALFVFKNGRCNWYYINELTPTQILQESNSEKIFRLQLKRKSLSPPVNVYYYIEQ